MVRRLRFGGFEGLRFRRWVWRGLGVFGLSGFRGGLGIQEFAFSGLGVWVLAGIQVAKVPLKTRHM